MGASQFDADRHSLSRCIRRRTAAALPIPKFTDFDHATPPAGELGTSRDAGHWSRYRARINNMKVVPYRLPVSNPLQGVLWVARASALQRPEIRGIAAAASPITLGEIQPRVAGVQALILDLGLGLQLEVG